MIMVMSRTQEPEHMTNEEEVNYANADFEVAHEAFVDYIIKNIDNNEGTNLKIADIGCGPGDILVRLRRRKNWDLYGLDISDQMLDLAKKREKEENLEKNINWVNTNSNPEEIENLKFDVVISNSVLHHMDGIKFWSMVKSISKKGTYIFVRDLRRPDHPYTAMNIMHQYVGSEPDVIRKHYLSSLHSSYTVEEVTEHLKELGITGLKISEVEDRYLDICGRLNFN